MKTKTLVLAIGIALVNCFPANALTTRLYQPSVGLTPNTSTADGGPYLTFGEFGGGLQTTLDGAGTNLDTTTTNANSTTAGYSNRFPNISTNPVTPGAFVNGAFPILDRTTGYTLSFNLGIISELSTSDNRAGFSVIALSNDEMGIEIGFSPSTSAIFAQNLDFTRGEFFTTNLTTLTPATNYDLAILGSSYTLSANSTTILTGNLRSYNAAALFNPYQTPDFIFLGDNTSQAQADINLGAVSLTTTPIPFEFSPALGLVGIGAWAIAKRVKAKKSKHK